MVETCSSLVARYLKHGLATFEDVEVLELLMGLQLDSVNHQYEARTLLNHFNSLSEIIESAAHISTYSSPLIEEYRLALRLPHEIANRYLFDRLKQRPLVGSPESVVDYLTHSMKGLKREHFKVLYLDGMNRLIADEDVSSGTVGQAVVYPREVMKSALRHSAAGLIFAHNHVSGNSKPSQDDIRITEKLSNAASLFDIVVHDHILIGGNSYFSFSEKGLIQKA